MGEVPGSISSQGPRHTKDVIKMVPVQYFPCSALNIKTGNIASFSRIMIGKINIMDTIQTGIEILRSRRSLAVVTEMKKTMTTQNRQKSNTKNKNKIMQFFVYMCIPSLK